MYGVQNAPKNSYVFDFRNFCSWKRRDIIVNLGFECPWFLPKMIAVPSLNPKKNLPTPLLRRKYYHCKAFYLHLMLFNVRKVDDISVIECTKSDCMLNRTVKRMFRWVFVFIIMSNLHRNAAKFPLHVTQIRTGILHIGSCFFHSTEHSVSRMNSYRLLHFIFFCIESGFSVLFGWRTRNGEISTGKNGREAESHLHIA